jgi:RimK family alpha-L-glutamate ligase
MKKRIAVFYGGKISRHLRLIRQAARGLGVGLDLISYNRVCFESQSGRIQLRNFGKYDNGNEGGEWLRLEDYGVLFFRTTGKHWEEVDLIIEAVRRNGNQMAIVDPITKMGKPSYACKAWQMVKLSEEGIGIPKTVYGSLWYLYWMMEKGDQIWKFPVILKGSGGDRGTRVFKADSLEELEKLVRDLRKTETEEGKRYMVQEFIDNEGDYRVLVLGEKVLGVMKRSRQKEGEFRNNFSMGGKVEVADLPEEIKEMAVRAAKVCGLMVAGVDVMPRFKMDRLSNKPEDYVILEVNKGPQFKGFMEATGIDVPKEIVKFLVSLSR